MRSGHEDFQSLFATNDQITPSFIVNRLGAPNESTVMVTKNDAFGKADNCDTSHRLDEGCV